MFPQFQILGNTIYTYPMLMGIAWSICYKLAKYFNNKYQINFIKINTYIFGLFLFSWIGAKLFFWWTADVEYKNFIENVSFWTGGGFVFYGGLIFGVLYTFIFGLLTRQPLFKFNLFLPVLALGHSVGRCACLLAGCCYGKSCSFPWAVRINGSSLHPTQLYESLFLLFLSFFMYAYFQKNKRSTLMFPLYILSYSIFRFFNEFFRADEVRGMWSIGYSTSQIIACCLILFSAAFIALKKVRS